ncbi:MAG: long-chain fatty acid--CoA ligase [Pseudooceanicola sp.]|nr:long-chain fatty acid--CoA ligase [Pseudooceanicola sp.]
MPRQTSYWERTTDAEVQEISTGDALRRAVATAPERTALIEVAPENHPSIVGAESTSRRWSYAELLEDAELCAYWLLDRFKPGEHICLWAPNVPEWIILQYGAALAGLVLVTANPALRTEELRHVLDRSQSVALFHVGEFRGSDMSSTAAEVTSSIRERIPLDNFLTRIRAETLRKTLPSVAPDSAAQVQFTSGTSGHPKGALLRHRSLVTNGAMVAHRIGQDSDVVLTPMPLFHTAGSVLGVLGAAATTSTLIIPLLFDPDLMLRTIEQEKATVIAGVPTMMAALLDQCTKKDYDLSSVRVAYSGGAPVPIDLCRRVEKAIGAALVSVYGQTELSPIVCATGPSDSELDKAETSGLPLPQVDVRIADPDTGQVVAIGVEGEVQARGYQTMIGYIGQPDDTARTLLDDGWSRTGDLGRMDERGYVRITGRLSDMIIRGGENIYPVEVENALTTHPAISQAAVFGIPDDYWGEIVAAVIIPHSGISTPAVEELLAHVRSKLSPQKSPSAWFTATSLPLTASGKIQKYVLTHQATDGTLIRL